MSEYVWRMHLAVPARQVELGGAVAARVLPGGEAEQLMFGVPMAAQMSDEMDGMDGAEFVGCCTLLTEAQREGLMKGFAEAGVEARWVRFGASAAGVVEDWSGLSEAPEAGWTWDRTVAALERST